MKKIKKIILGFIATIVVLFSLSSVGAFGSLPMVNASTRNANVMQKAALENKEHVYLSDIDYLPNPDSFVGWGQIKKDQVVDGQGKVTLKVNGVVKQFTKSIGAHATSQVIYDISSWNQKYPMFYTKLGVDASRNGNGNVIFTISVSNDKQNWTDIAKSPEMTSGMEAFTVYENVEGYRYLRLYADKNGGEQGDHSVYGDAMLTKPITSVVDEYPNIKSISEYDALIKSREYADNVNNHRDDLLKRDLVYRLGGKSGINYLLSQNAEYKDTFDWLVTDKDALRLLFEAGDTKKHQHVFKALNVLYTQNKHILSNIGDGFVYKKMLIALAVVYGDDSVFSSLKFNSYKYNNFSTLLRKFELYKKLYDTNKFIRKDEFKTYNMELMRMVMNTSISNEEIIWLREYSEIRYPKNPYDRFKPFAFMEYINPNYAQQRFFDEKNKDVFDKKYHLTEFNVEYIVTDKPNNDITKTWMAMEAGGICWNMSRLSQDINKVHGIPSVGTYQPGHEAFFYYSEDSRKNGIWSIGFNNLGWKNSYSTWFKGNPIRLLLNWNNLPLALGVDKDNNVNYSSTYNSTYMLVAQAALNRYQDLQTSEYYKLLANSYSGEIQQQLDIYDFGLNFLGINVSIYQRILELYRVANKEEAEWLTLANRVFDNFTYYPNVLVDALKIIKPHLSNLSLLDVNKKISEKLSIASKATSANTLQPNECREIANHLMGENDVPLADFSFDGPNAGKIVINKKYDTFDFMIEYSVNGGTTWSKTSNHQIQLSQTELAQINAKDGIIVRIVGTAGDFKINIVNGKNINRAAFSENDYENRFMGDVQDLEYSYNKNDWYDYEADTRFLGDVIVFARYKSKKNMLPGEIEEFRFSLDDTEYKYVNVDRIDPAVWTGTPHEPGYDPYHMIDSSIYTKWHTKYNTFAHNKAFLIAFKEPIALKKIVYEPYESVNGRIKDVTFSVKFTSQDKNWTEIGSTTWANDAKPKEFIIPNAQKIISVMILPNHTYGTSKENNDKYVSGRRFNFFEESNDDINFNDISGLVNSFVYTGKEIKQTFTISKGGVTLAEGKDYTANYLNNTNVGVATLEIRGLGEYVINIDYKFNITKAPNGVELTIENGMPVATAKFGTPVIKYYNELECITEISEPTKNGTYYARAIVDGTKNYEGGASNVVEFTINNLINIELTDISGLVNSFVYTGKEIKQTFTISKGGVTLAEGKDYTANYLNNTNVGEATLEIRGLGSYAINIDYKFNITKAPNSVTLEKEGNTFKSTAAFGSPVVKYYSDRECKTEVSEPTKNGTYYARAIVDGTKNYEGGASNVVEFTINNLINIELTDISGLVNSFVYTGKEIKQTFTISKGGVTLAEGKDYTANYLNNTNVGEATLEIRGLGEYVINIDYKFNITKAPNGVELTIENGIPVATAKFGTPVIKYYSDKECLNPIEQPTQAGTYYVRATVEGNVNYTQAQSEVLEFVVADTPLINITNENINGIIKEAMYTGNPITMPVVVEIDGKALEKGIDYEIVYKNNVNVGTAILIVVGKGKYTGSISYEFTIKKAQSKVEIDIVDDEIKVNSTFGEPIIKYYSDKECKNEIAKPTEAGTYYVKAVIVGTDNYEGYETEPKEYVVRNAINPDVPNVEENNNNDDRTMEFIIYGSIGVAAVIGVIAIVLVIINKRNKRR